MPRSLLLLLPLQAAFLVGASAPALAQKRPAATPRPVKPVSAPPVRATPATGEALIEALEQEDVPRALALVQRGADPNALSADRGNSALGLAASLGDQKLIQALLDRKAHVNPTDIDTQPPLALALSFGRVEAARLLIENGANTNAQDGESYSRRPLVLAAALGSVPLVTLLLDKGAELNHTPSDGLTALAEAAESGNTAVVELLVARGARVKEDKLVLRYALVSGSVPTVRFLLSQGRSLTETIPNTTLLHLAATGGSPELIQMVLDAGVAIDATDAAGETPLMNAARQYQTEAIRFLLGKKARIDIISTSYQSARDVAEEEKALEEEEIKARQKATIAVLEKAGAKPAPPSLWRAALREEPTLLKNLLEKGDDPNEADANKAVPLFYALADKLSSRSTPLVKALLAHGANPNAKAPDGRTLVTVARDEQIEEAVALLRQAGAETPELDLTEAVERNDTAVFDAMLAHGVVPESDTLIYAIGRRDRALLTRLLEKGAKVNTRTRIRGFLFISAPDFALQAAVESGDIESAKILLDHGADPNARREDGPTALHKVMAEDPEVVDALVRLLVERGADVRVQASGSFTGGSVLASLSLIAPVKTLEFLLAHGALADMNPPADADVPAPLTLAVRGGKPANVQFLLEHGATPNPPERFARESPLMDIASSKGTPEDIAIAKLLLEHGARTEVKDSIGRTVLQIAEDSHNTGIAKLVRAAGGKSGITPGAEMMRAISRDDLVTVRRLLKEGFDPSTRILGGDVPLYEAAFQGSEDILNLLLERGADVNGKGTLGTPLHGAAASSDPDLVRLLLARGAKVDADDGFQGTPLVRAAEEGAMDVMRILLKAGADPSAQNSSSPGAPLEKALQKGGDEAVELLLKAGANPNLGDPLFRLLWFGDVKRMERLIRAGAKVNNRNSLGRTVLMEAAAMGQKETVAWLIAHKADVNIQDNRGRTALQDALERDKTECVQLLRKAGAK